MRVARPARDAPPEAHAARDRDYAAPARCPCLRPRRIHDQARARIEAAWARLDAHLAAHGPHLLGDQLTTADFMLTMLMRWSRNMPRTATAWPALARLAAIMKARPAFKAVYAREGLTDWT